MNYIIEHGVNRHYGQYLIVNDCLKYGQYWDNVHKEWVLDKLELVKWVCAGNRTQSWWVTGIYRNYQGSFDDIKALLMSLAQEDYRKAMAKL